MVEFLPSKQAVAGSSPVSRSIRRKGGDCLTKMSIDSLLTRYNLAARAEGLSPKTVEHVKLALRLFDSFMVSRLRTRHEIQRTFSYAHFTLL